jgi:hypothetical protein
MTIRPAATGLALMFAVLSCPAMALTGTVLDASTHAGLAGAVVTLGAKATISSADGSFSIEGEGTTLRARAPGFARRDMALDDVAKADGKIELSPFRPKALYLTVHGIGSSKLREGALDLLAGGDLNALVIDVKGDKGEIPFKISVPLADAVGAQKLITVKDMPALMARLKGLGIYTIARIVVFKDDPLATARPELAVRVKGGGLFRDREDLHWVDPFNRDVWAYNIAIAKEAAAAGFDEVQFDYVRFPDKRGVVFSMPADEDTRSKAIAGFLGEASKALLPFNVFVSADIFGYVCWNTNDTDVGQKIDLIAGSVDIVSPMLYPSGFQFGIPGYRNPVQHSYEIVYQSLARCRERIGVSPLRFRPWLQAFRDYAFGGGNFGAREVGLQVKAAQDFGASGFNVWNPHNIYPEAGYKP